MKVHPRTELCQQAEAKFGTFMLALERDYHLTTCETLQMMNQYQRNLLKYVLREERHPGEEGVGGDEE